MARPPDRLRGLVRLATDATLGTADVVEAVHARFSFRRSTRASGRRGGISGLAYRAVRGTARLAGRSADAALRAVALRAAARPAGDAPDAPRREALVAALNGVVGDGLAATGNPLALAMRLRRRGVTLDLATLAAALPDATPDVLVLVHGLCMSDAGWARPGGHDHGAALERDAGLTAVYLHYNTGRHISTNGREVADLLDRLVAGWPVPVRSLTLLCHSMGGLVARSAVAQAAPEAPWRRALARVVFLGTPHHGSPVERAGNRLDRLLLRTRLTAPLAGLGHVRSAGITDLRHGLLLDADWHGHDRFAARADPRTPVPLPHGVEAYAIAATPAAGVGTLAGRLVGDGLVPVASATGRHADAAHDLGFAPERVHVAPGVHHFGLLGPAVYSVLRGWLAPAGDSAGG